MSILDHLFRYMDRNIVIRSSSKEIIKNYYSDAKIILGLSIKDLLCDNLESSIQVYTRVIFEELTFGLVKKIWDLFISPKEQEYLEEEFIIFLNKINKRISQNRFE